MRDQAPPSSIIGLLFTVVVSLLVTGLTGVTLYVVLDRYFEGHWIRWWKLLGILAALAVLHCAVRRSDNLRRIRPFLAVTAGLTLTALAALAAFSFLFVFGLQPEVVAAWRDPGWGEAAARSAVLFVAAVAFLAWALTAPDRLRDRVFLRGPRTPVDSSEVSAGAAGGQGYANIVRLLVVGAVGAIVTLWLVISPLDPFRSHVDEYLRGATGEPTGDPYVAGKVIPIDRGRQRIDGLVFFKLPWELRPARPEEVGTVVWLKCSEETVATYESGASAYQRVCDVTVIDRARNRSVAFKEFRNDKDPPDTKYDQRDWHSGGRPIKKIVAYIRELPRRSSS